LRKKWRLRQPRLPRWNGHRRGRAGETFAERFFGSGGNIAASFGNFLQILGALFTDRHFFRLLDG